MNSYDFEFNAATWFHIFVVQFLKFDKKICLIQKRKKRSDSKQK